MTTRISANENNGDVTLKTGRAGVASKAGHDLTLLVGSWSAEATLEDDGTVTAFRVVAPLHSLEVLRGDGGVKPVTDKDKGTILGHAMETLKATRHPELVFEASDVKVAVGHTTVDGQVTLAGVTKPQTLDLDVRREDGKVILDVRGELVQSDFGIQPYSGMLGALKVRDMVEIRADVALDA